MSSIISTVKYVRHTLGPRDSGTPSAAVSEAHVASTNSKGAPLMPSMKVGSATCMHARNVNDRYNSKMRIPRSPKHDDR